MGEGSGFNSVDTQLPHVCTRFSASVQKEGGSFREEACTNTYSHTRSESSCLLLRVPALFQIHFLSECTLDRLYLLIIPGYPEGFLIWLWVR